MGATGLDGGADHIRTGAQPALSVVLTDHDAAPVSTAAASSRPRSGEHPEGPPPA